MMINGQLIAVNLEIKMASTCKELQLSKQD